MRLRRLGIENFRGVRSLDWRHIPETAALVGPGDSAKSTILDAIISVGYRLNSTQATRFRVRQDHEFESDFEAEVKRIESDRPRKRKKEP